MYLNLSHTHNRRRELAKEPNVLGLQTTPLRAVAVWSEEGCRSNLTITRGRRCGKSSGATPSHCALVLAAGLALASPLWGGSSGPRRLRKKRLGKAVWAHLPWEHLHPHRVPQLLVRGHLQVFPDRWPH